MSHPLQIFLGWDPREHSAFEVAEFSIRRRCSAPLIIHPLLLVNLGHVMHRPIERHTSPTGQVQLWCPISNAPMATEFAISRFCVPFLQQEGWALFVDCDVLCLADIAELFALRDDRYALQVVKHQQKDRLEACPTFKMDGQLQTFYARKNWSSVILWNCGHPAHARLTHKRLNGWPGRDLHAFGWLDDAEIGELPAEWNYLVGVQGQPATRHPQPAALLHYTLGGPWFHDWKGGDHDDLWLSEWAELKLWREHRKSCPCHHACA